MFERNQTRVSVENTQFTDSDNGLYAEHTVCMEEDAQTLEVLFTEICRLWPPGPGRDFWLSQLRRVAVESRCPHWPLGREFFFLKRDDPPASGPEVAGALPRHRIAGSSV